MNPMAVETMSPPRSTGQSPTDGAVDRGDSDQHDEPWQCECHVDLLRTSRFAQNTGVRSRRVKTRA